MALSNGLADIFQTAQAAQELFHGRPQEERRAQMDAFRDQRLFDARMKGQQLQNQIHEEKYETLRRGGKLRGIAHAAKREALQKAQETGENSEEIYADILSNRIHQDDEARELLDLTTQEVSLDKGARFEGFTDPLRHIGFAGRNEDTTHGVLYRTSDGQLDVLSDGNGDDARVFEVPSDPSAAYEAAWQYSPDAMAGIEKKLREQQRRNSLADAIGPQGEALPDPEQLSDEARLARKGASAARATVTASDALERGHSAARTGQAAETARSALPESGDADQEAPGSWTPDGYNAIDLYKYTFGQLPARATHQMVESAKDVPGGVYHHGANLGRGLVRAIGGQEAVNAVEDFSQNVEGWFERGAENVSQGLGDLKAAVTTPATEGPIGRGLRDGRDGMDQGPATQPSGQSPDQDQPKTAKAELPPVQVEGEASRMPTLSDEQRAQLARSARVGRLRAREADKAAGAAERQRKHRQQQEQAAELIRQGVDPGIVQGMLESGGERESKIITTDSGAKVNVIYGPDGRVVEQQVLAEGETPGPLDDVQNKQNYLEYIGEVGKSAGIPEDSQTAFNSAWQAAVEQGLIDPTSQYDVKLANSMRNSVAGDIGGFLWFGKDWKDVSDDDWVDSILAQHAGFESPGQWREHLAQNTANIGEETGGTSYDMMERASTLVSQLQRQAGLSHDEAKRELKQVLSKRPQVLKVSKDRFNNALRAIIEEERNAQGGTR